MSAVVPGLGLARWARVLDCDETAARQELDRLTNAGILMKYESGGVVAWGVTEPVEPPEIAVPT